MAVPYGGSKRQADGTPRPYYTYRDDETVLSGKPLLEQLDVWVKYVIFLMSKYLCGVFELEGL